MSTALVPIDKNQYAALAEGSEIAEAIRYNMQAGQKIGVNDLVRIPNPTGGGLKWVWEGISGEESSPEIEGILVHHQPRGVLWPSEDISNEPPVLVTHDLQHAHRVGEFLGDIDEAELAKYVLRDGTYDWPRLPWNKWGTSKNGIGKRCKESRMLFILRPSDPWPVLVSAQPGSLKTVSTFIMRLSVPHFRCAIALGLQRVKSKSGIDYSQIKPRLTGMLDQETGKRIFDMYTVSLRDLAVELPVERDDASDD